MTLKAGRDSSIFWERRACVGHTVSAHWSVLSEIVPMDFASSGDPLDKLIYWSETVLHGSHTSEHNIEVYG